MESTDTTAMGGLALADQLVSKLGIAKLINGNLSLLQSNRPFHESDWKPFRAREEEPRKKGRKKRKRGQNLRSKRARERGKRDLKLEKQWLAEISYKPARSERTYRLIVRRQRIEESHQGELFELGRYRYVLTNMPRSESTEAVLRQAYRRCDAELRRHARRMNFGSGPASSASIRADASAERLFQA